jgi:hypothetical protein
VIARLFFDRVHRHGSDETLGSPESSAAALTCAGRMQTPKARRLCSMRRGIPCRAQRVAAAIRSLA